MSRTVFPAVLEGLPNCGLWVTHGDEECFGWRTVVFFEYLTNKRGHCGWNLPGGGGGPLMGIPSTAEVAWASHLVHISEAGEQLV